MMLQRAHIGVLVERRYLKQSQPARLIAALQARGYRVTTIDPLAAVYRIEDQRWWSALDLIVCRGRSWAVLSLLAWAEQCGLPTINRRSAIAAVHDKALMGVVLAANGVPTPRTFLGPVDCLAQQVSASSYPLLLKPVFGDNCRGLRLVHDPGELYALTWPDPVALAQQYLCNDGYDLKLYGIGDEIWAVRKRSLFGGQTPSGATRQEPQAAELLPLTPELQQLGQRCGAIFGLELFGVDCIHTPDGPVVIEVNDFPNYSGVPAVDERLAEYVVRRVRSEQCMESAV